MSADAEQGDWLRFWRLTRPGFLSITAVGCFIGLATAAACGCGFDMVKAAITITMALLAHAGANVLNDYEDTRCGTDQINQTAIRPFTGGSRLIVDGIVSAPEARAWAWTLLGICALGGLWLALHSGPGLLVIGLCGLALGWAYSMPPIKLMSRGLGELAVAISWWLIVVGADYVQRGQFFIINLVAGVSFGLLTANILLINGLPDAVSDAATGKHTLATRLSLPQITVLYTALVVIAHGWVMAGVWLQIHPTTAWLACLTVIPGLWGAALLASHSKNPSPSRLRQAIGLTIATANVHGILLAVGMVIPRWQAM